MIEFNEREQEPGEDGGGLSVAVVGIGGAGANVLDRIALEGMTEAELVCMNTDIRALTNSVAATKVQLGKNLTQGLGAGGDPDLGEDAAKSSEEEIRNAVRGRDIVFVCGGLGGGTGSGAAPFISGIARSEGAFVVAFTTMPFSFEGRRRLSQAQSSLNTLRKTANALITFDNDRMGSLVLPKQGIQEAFAEADKIISQSVRAVIQLVTKPGLISIGMDDLITALDNDDSRCLFGYGQATGENRAQEALGKALKSPLLDKGEMLEEAQNVLVHVCGGDSMTLFEVELLMKSLEKEVSDKAQILFGVGSDPKLGDKLSVTVISSMGKPLPPTTDDKAPKAARSESGDEQNDSADAESSKPGVPESSRSEVKPDQPTEKKTVVPLATAATTLGVSMLAGNNPKAAAPSPPRARMSPIRRAVQPLEERTAAESESNESAAVPPDEARQEGRSSAVTTGSKPGSKPGSSRKGVISIFEDDDEEDADSSENLFDDTDDDLDDDLDLMGDLGLDDEELDRLVAESAAVGLDDDESDEDDTGDLALIEDAELEKRNLEASEAGRASEVESTGVEVVSESVEVEITEVEIAEVEIAEVEIAEVEAGGESPAVEEEEIAKDPFEEIEDDFATDEDLDEATVVAGAAVLGTPVAVPGVEPVAAEAAEEDDDADADDADADDAFLSDSSDEDDDFESFDNADDLEEDFDELEVVEEADEEFASETAEVSEDFDEEENADLDDPLFGEEQDEVSESIPSTPSHAVAARVAPAQSNKADELLKRVGLRRAPGAVPPGKTPVAAVAPVAAEHPQSDAPGGSKTRFAWSKPGTVPAAAPGDKGGVSDDDAESRSKLPPPRVRGGEPTAAPAPAPKDESAGDSPFTPKGFVKKRPEAVPDQPRRGLPIQPTPLKLNAVPPSGGLPATSAPGGEAEPMNVVEEPEQQTFDSTLEPKPQKGRFEKGEPTVEDGEDLDLPTFLRRRKG